MSLSLVLIRHIDLGGMFIRLCCFVFVSADVTQNPSDDSIDRSVAIFLKLKLKEETKNLQDVRWTRFHLWSMHTFFLACLNVAVTNYNLITGWSADLRLLCSSVKRHRLSWWYDSYFYNLNQANLFLCTYKVVFF